METGSMDDPAGAPPRARHTLADWLTLHALDPRTCGRVLDTIVWDAVGEPAAEEDPGSDDGAPDLEGTWRDVVAAMRDFLPDHRGIIDDTFENTARVVMDRRDGSRKALTLDNGPAAYPTILFSYRGEPADALVMAHEFAHALQLRASGGRFVPPVMREVCAFLGEGALLAHASSHAPARHAGLARAWRRDSDRYFGVQRNRLHAALTRPAAPYRYSWNYPIARDLAIRVAAQCSPARIWSIFAGEVSVRDALRDLSLPPARSEPAQ